MSPTPDQFLGGGGFTVEPAQKSISAEEFLGAGADQEVAPQERTDAAPTGLEAFGLDPNVQERGAVLPIGRDAEGNLVLTPSEMMLEIMKAISLPSRVLQGHTPTQEELLNFTAVTVGGGVRGALSGVRRATGAAPKAGTQAARDATQAADEALRVATETGVPPGADVSDLQAAARQARFSEQGIPATRGDITQDFAQQAEESRLVSMAGAEAGEPLRQVRLQQSEAFIGKVDDLVNSLGVPKNTGDAVKDALTGRISLLRSEKTALYKQVADAAPEITNAPIITDDIVLALPDAKTTRRLRILAPNSVKAADDLLVEFGLNTTDDAMEAFVASGGEVTPLTLGNFDDFRIALGQIDRSDTTGAVKVITGPIRRALDEEAAFIDDAIRESGITDQSIVATLKEARSRVRTLKTEFSPQSITGRLTGARGDGVTPVVEASKVSNELLRPGAPIENLQRTITSLGNAGVKGKTAIGDLQSSVVMDALEAALKAPSRKTSGIETIGGNQFAKALDKFGDDKLDLLFKGNPQALKTLRDLKQTGLDISPTAGAVPKGSASVMLDLFNRFGRLPGLAAVVDVVKLGVTAGADDRAVRRALDSASPVVKQTLQTINLKYPNIAGKLGILLALPEAEQ